MGIGISGAGRSQGIGGGQGSEGYGDGSGRHHNTEHDDEFKTLSDASSSAPANAGSEVGDKSGGDGLQEQSLAGGDVASAFGGSYGDALEPSAAPQPADDPSPSAKSTRKRGFLGRFGFGKPREM